MTLSVKAACDELAKFRETLLSSGDQVELGNVVITEIIDSTFSINLQGNSNKIDPLLTNPLIANVYNPNETTTYRQETYGYYATLSKDRKKLYFTCKAPSLEASPYKGQNVNQNVTSDCIAVTQEEEVAKVKANLCVPILKEYWGVKFNFKEDNEDKMWALSLAPAVRSQANNSVPNAMPGLRIQASTKFAKKEIPGWHSIYQPMGVDTVYVTMVGTFTGDGGYRGNATYQPGNFAGRDNPKFPIDPTTNPNFNVGNRLISGVQEFNDNASVGKLIDRIGVENAVMANFVNREGMFDRVGCDGDCPPVYRGLFGDADGAIKYPDFSIGNPGAPGTYTRQELNAYLDAYHEFDDFMRLSVIEGREMDVEINMRKSMDSLRPFDKRWQPNENTLRNATTGNIAFKGVVKNMDVYAARANRVWYTIIMEVTDLGNSDLASTGAGWDYQIYSEEDIEQTISLANTPESKEQSCANDLSSACRSVLQDPDLRAFIGSVLVKEELIPELIGNTLEIRLQNKVEAAPAVLAPLGVQVVAGFLAALGKLFTKVKVLVAAGKAGAGSLANPFVWIAILIAVVALVFIYIVERFDLLGFTGLDKRLLNTAQKQINDLLRENSAAANLTVTIDKANRKLIVTCK